MLNTNFGFLKLIEILDKIIETFEKIKLISFKEGFSNNMKKLQDLIIGFFLEKIELAN